MKQNKTILTVRPWRKSNSQYLYQVTSRSNVWILLENGLPCLCLKPDLKPWSLQTYILRSANIPQTLFQHALPIVPIPSKTLQLLHLMHVLSLKFLTFSTVTYEHQHHESFFPSENFAVYHCERTSYHHHHVPPPACRVSFTLNLSSFLLVRQASWQLQ